jgi:hypothetical protein
VKVADQKGEKNRLVWVRVEGIKLEPFPWRESPMGEQKERIQKLANQIIFFFDDLMPDFLQKFFFLHEEKKGEGRGLWAWW